MYGSTLDQGARDRLRRLTTPHALHFGARLLRRGKDGVLTFREFVAVARELVEERPEDTAIYLAALIALDIAGPDGDAHEQPDRSAAPSRN